MYIKAYSFISIMSKTLKHHKRKQRRANRTQRLRMTGGGDFAFNGNNVNTGELNALLSQPNHHVLAKHYSDTCTHCKNLETEWDEVMDRLKNPSFTVANLGPGATDYMNKHHYRRHKYRVHGVPTIVYIHKIKNVKPIEYQGERTANAIIAWITKILADNNLEISIQSKSQPSEPVSEPVSEQANTFPPAPTPSSVLSNATQTVKNAAAKMDQTISNGIDSVKSVLTNEFDIGEKIGNLFSSSSSSDPVAQSTTVSTPLVPSLVGGRRTHTRRKNRRSKSNKKSKSKKYKYHGM